ncbi:hypothetical protein [Natrinema altunense]|uniref:Uncharacterized protein n=1 Tax=Natrinema altunense TaxID=222984 RepID=A0A482XYA3_9EURY|nr:hypothetical protein [Natrinema altunense]RZH67033.1 hypothetical protein ELS17_14770 [Natrinema altunense]
MSSITPLLGIAIALFGGLLALSSTICLCYIIGADAAARGASGVGWALFSVFLLPIAGPAYVVYRTRLPARDDPPARLERRLGAFGIGGTAAAIVSALVAPPDPVTQLLAFVPLVLVFVPVVAAICYDPSWGARFANRF